METIKEESLKAISKLPDESSIEEIMYRLYVIDKIRKGEKDIQNGDFISSEQLKEEMKSW